MTTIELATFRVSEDAVEALVAERPRMIEALRVGHPALEQAYLTRMDDGSFCDVIVWATREAALVAAAEAAAIPAVRAWFAHITESGGIRHAEVLDSYVPGG